jgi:hypothetical protein
MREDAVAEAPKVFLVESDRDPMGRLVPRLLALGTEIVAVASIKDAIRLLEDRAPAAQLVFFPMLARRQLGQIVDSIRKASGRTGARFVGVGRRPIAEERKILESARVEAFLWEPIADTQLRFVINEAGYETREGRVRKSPRVPTAIAARMITDVGERDALVYSLSEGGAYLETPRAMTAGARLKIAFPLPCGTISVDARVLHSNVSGNLQQENLALGMGVEFIKPDAETRAIIADYVDESLELLTGRKLPGRTIAPPEEEAQPKERRRYPRLDFLKTFGRRGTREEAEPEQIASADAPPPTEGSRKAEHGPVDSANKVMVRCRDGRLIKGHTFDFLPHKDVFHVVSPHDENEITELRSSEPEAILFVKSFDGNNDHAARKNLTREDLRGLRGVKLEVRFRDGEVMYGTTHGYHPGRKGFFLFPADETSNNIRVYVYEDATESVEVLR